jgi:hypothetical protein
MDDTLAVAAGVVFVLIVVVVALVAVLTRRRRRGRAGRLEGWAHENGWTVTRRPVVDWGVRLPGGNRDGIATMISGRVRGRPVSVAEYVVTGGRTDVTMVSPDNIYAVTVAVLAQPLPGISVEPRGPTSLRDQVVAGPGESATGNVAFDRTYRIRTNDPDAVPRWCTSQVIEAHLRGQIPAWSVHGNELLTYENGRLIPAAIPGRIGPVTYLADLLDQSAAR